MFKSISKYYEASSLLTAMFNLDEPLLLVTVAILLGGVFHSITILYPAMLESRAKRQHSITQINNYKDQAYRDPLTGLHNRRYFDATLEAYFMEFNRQGLTFGLLTFDVDHFKKVNDTYGHSVGDSVLIEIAKCVQSLAREHDVIARIGGEEFAVIITNVNEHQLLSIADRFREKIANLSIDVEGDVINPTISVGAVTSPKFENTDLLFEVADQCLYRAKEAGRNCVITYSN